MWTVGNWLLTWSNSLLGTLSCTIFHLLFFSSNSQSVWSPKLQWQWATNWPIQVAITSREKRKSQFHYTLKKTFTCNLIPALWLQLNVKFKEIVNFLPVWILLLFIEGHTHWILHITWSPDGKKLASGCKNGEVRKLWCNIII